MVDLPDVVKDPAQKTCPVVGVSYITYTNDKHNESDKNPYGK